MSGSPDMGFMKLKAGLLLTVFLLLWSGLVYRLHVLQFRDAPRLVKQADRQHEGLIKVHPRRGQILDRNGNLLAVSVKVKSLYCVPGEIQNIWTAASALEPILNVSRNQLIRRFTRDGKFAWIKRKLTDTETESVAALSLPGFYLFDEVKRLYPKGRMLSQVIGFVDIDNQGLSGLEQSMDDILKGSTGLCRVRHDGAGKELVAAREMLEEPENGFHVTLTIDEVIQNIVEEEIDLLREEHQADGVMILVTDVQSGDLLAIANRPTFDLNAANLSQPEERRNRAFTDTFEPGSTFKAVSAAMVLNERLTWLEEPIYCEGGAFRLAGHTLRDSRPHDTLSFQEVIAKSSNIGFAKVVYRTQPEVFHRYIKDFGFGTAYDLPLPGQSGGFVRPHRKWSGYSMAALGMGYEIRVTPLQMTYAYATIASGGVRVFPRLVKRVEDREKGQEWIYPVKHGKRILDPKTVRLLKRALVQVVSADGTAPRAVVPGYQVAGKTGTAQKVVNGRYSRSHHVASFVGFVPAENPVLVISVMVDEPKGKLRYGGSVSGPAFAAIAGRTLHYLKIQPDTRDFDLLSVKEDAYVA